MVFGTIVGGLLGVSAGAFACQHLPIYKKQPKSYDYIDVMADMQDDIRSEWSKAAKDDEVKRVLERCPIWCTFPDYERMLWLNNFINIVWHQNGEATKKTIEMVIRDGMAEWQKLAEESTKGVVKLEEINIEKFDFGTSPFKVSGLKLYNTSQDEVILDMPVNWGSDVDLRVSVKVSISGKVAFYLPVQIKDIQLVGKARITMRPLVEQIPILGAVNITLLESPIVHMNLSIGDSPDIMIVPGMKVLLNAIIKIALGKLLVYPNSMMFEIMENAGQPKPMEGMLVCDILSANKLPSSTMDKVDPYVEVEVRKHRSLRTQVMKNNADPVWEDEKLRFVIDDVDKQKIRILVKDSDLLEDAIIGYCEVPLAGAPFVTEPRTEWTYTAGLQLVSKKKNKAFDAAIIDEVEAAKAEKQAQSSAASSAGSTHNAEASPSTGSHTFLQRRAERKAEERAARDGPSEVTINKEAKTVYIPGSGKRQQGTLTFKVQYYPFRADTAEETGETLANKYQMATLAKVAEDETAVITATLMACYNLPEGCDPYVHIKLYDRLQGRTEVVKAPSKMNETNPRWDMKFDFVSVTAASYVTVIVYDAQVSSMLPNIVGKAAGVVTGLLKRNTEARMVGWYEFPLMDVAKNGVLKDCFNLRDAVKGEIELKFEWHHIKRCEEDVQGLKEQMAVNKAAADAAFADAHAD